ncbi:MAG: hypothetical protein WDZ51_03340 [Pirellulaceae bacterium]
MPTNRDSLLKYSRINRNVFTAKPWGRIPGTHDFAEFASVNVMARLMLSLD